MLGKYITISIMLLTLYRCNFVSGFQTAVGQVRFKRFHPVFSQIAQFHSSGIKREKNPGIVAGTSLHILTYPNPKLRQDNELITEFDDDLKKTVKEMFQIMYAADGVGLAAPQLGINKRLMVFNPSGPDSPQDEYAIVNPRITSYSSLCDIEDEACLSFPDIWGKVKRSISILVEYQTITGQHVARRYHGYLGRIFQHEYDHLEKTLLVDRFFPEDRARNQWILNKMIKDFKENNPDLQSNESTE